MTRNPIGPVLVLDGWERMALAACRALGREGVEIGTAGHHPAEDYAARSRYARRYHALPDPMGPITPYENALREVVATHGYVAIVSCHDATLARLASITTLPAPTLSVLDDAWRRVQDKVALADICGRLGVGYPQTERIAASGEIDGVLKRLGAPIFVKSAQSAVASPDRVPFQRGARRAETPAEAADMIARLLDEGLPVIAQAGIAHSAKLNAVLLRAGGRTELRYAHRVLREHPSSGGTGITLQTVAPGQGDGAEVLAVLEGICEETGLEGIVQAEFYRGVDGKIYVLDVNPRLWGSTWFAERLGLRVVERCVRAALGLPGLGPAAYRVGRRFHVPNTEVKWVLAHDDPWRGARELIRDTRPWDVFEYVDPRDPQPNIAWARHKVARLLGRS